MSLTFQLDANLRPILEPGFVSYFPAPLVGQEALPADAISGRQAWQDPEFGTIMLKPLQLQDDFLNHPAQLSTGAVLRLDTDLFANPSDRSSNLVFEANVGTVSNPWVFHVPASPALAAPTLTLTGPNLHYNLTSVANVSETGFGAVFSASPGAGPPAAAPKKRQKKPPGATDFQLGGTTPNDTRPIVDTMHRLPANQGFFFRWHMPDPRLGLHQTLYAFTFGQYCVVCRNVLMEVYRDVSPAGDRTRWNLEFKKQMFGATSQSSLSVNSSWGFGQQALSILTGADRSLLVMPYRRNRVLLMTDTGQRMILTVRNKPEMLPDNSDWDITRSDSVQVWALTPVYGRFQVQKLKYEPGPVTLNFPTIITEYTPVNDPFIVLQADVFHSESMSASLQFPQLYSFPMSPIANDCPPPTILGSAQSRSYGCTLTYGSSPDQNFSPQYYGLQVQATEVFQDNPNAAVQVSDTTGASLIRSAEISLGVNPGEGHMTAEVLDALSYPLAPYYFRSELPVQLALNGTPIFTGYSDRIEMKPWRATKTPRSLTVRAQDRWLLLENSFLRSQKDYTNTGHITTVDFIARQCGIDTHNPAAEYPAGWDGDMASTYDTPLGTPIFDANNLTGEQQLGWQPQPLDTGSAFIKRIAENYSGWLVGFRSTGAFFYLPYNYFTTPSANFHVTHGGVMTGLMPSASVGLSVSISAGTAQTSGGGGAVSPGMQAVSGLADNSTNYLYLDRTGAATSNTTGDLPAGSIALGTATTTSGAVTGVDTTRGSGRQLSTDPVYRSPVEHRTIEPSGNVVQVLSHYQVDYTANRSGLFVDWASIKNPAAPNYLGHYKWFLFEVAGAFSCPQLNAMAYIVFQQARRRRKRISFSADYVPGLEIGHVVNLSGIGSYRILEMRARYIRTKWDIAEYVGESTEQGY